MFSLKEDWAHSDVVGGRVVFGDIICLEVFVSRDPINYKLFLFYLVLNPVEAHIDGFGLFMFYCVVGEDQSQWHCRLA